MKINNRLKMIGLVVAISAIVTGCGISDEEQAKIDGYDTIVSENEELKNSIKELEKKVEEAKPWFDMADEEQKKIEEEAKKIEEENKKQAELEAAKKLSRIGETIIFENGEGQFSFTLNDVSLTSERNQFADPVKNVVKISYTVENISMGELDFFITNSANFYDADGYKCSAYPNSSGPGTYDIGTGKKANGVEFIGIEGSDSKYLEMQLFDTEFKWVLE